MNTLQAHNISKTIKGNVIFSSLDFSMEKGKIYGLVGENGSGKTMLIRLLAGLIKPTQGEIRVDGVPVDLFSHRNFSVGIVIENISLYPEMTGLNNLKYLASINRQIHTPDIEAVLTEVGLDAHDPRKVRKYSLGMKQKLSLAQAFMENPDLILLDEPTNALDEASVMKFRELIRKHAKRGAIILIASHNKEDILSLCDCVYRVNHQQIEVLTE